MTSHVDAETLALSAEGLLDEDDERAVREHVAQCDECSELSSALGDVSRTLADAPVPPLPESVVTRIDTTLRAEIAANPGAGAGRDTGDHGRPAGESGGTTPLHQAGSPARWMPYIAAAAAAVFIIGGALAMVRGITSPSNEGESVPNAATDDPTSGKGPDTAPSYHEVIVASGTSYTARGLDHEATDVLAKALPSGDSDDSGDSESHTEATGTTSLPSPTDTPSNVSSCTEKLGKQREGKRPAVIDIAEYQGKDAWVLYYGTSSGGSQDTYDVMVVPPDCGGQDSGDIGLAETTVPAP